MFCLFFLVCFLFGCFFVFLVHSIIFPFSNEWRSLDVININIYSISIKLYTMFLAHVWIIHIPIIMHFYFDTIMFGKNMFQYGVLTAHCHNFGTLQKQCFFCLGNLRHLGIGAYEILHASISLKVYTTYAILGDGLSLCLPQKKLLIYPDISPIELVDPSRPMSRSLKRRRRRGFLSCGSPILQIRERMGRAIFSFLHSPQLHMY